MTVIARASGARAGGSAARAHRVHIPRGVDATPSSRVGGGPRPRVEDDNWPALEVL